MEEIELNQHYGLIYIPADTYFLTITPEVYIDDNWVEVLCEMDFRDIKQAREDCIQINEFRPENVPDIRYEYEEKDGMYIPIGIPDDIRKMTVECELYHDEKTIEFTMKDICEAISLYDKYDPNDEFYALYQLTEEGEEWARRLQDGMDG